MEIAPREAVSRWKPMIKSIFAVLNPQTQPEEELESMQELTFPIKLTVCLNLDLKKKKKKLTVC
jgi:hypothetical protein